MIALCNFILSPIHVAIIGHSNIVIGLNFTLVILAGYLLSDTTRFIRPVLILGIFTLVMIWGEGLLGIDNIMYVRLALSFVFFLFICYVLAYSIINANDVDVYLILDAVSGFLLLGLLGGILFESLELIMPGSFSIENRMSGFLFYYYSFITTTSIGYGDIVPVTPQAKSIAILWGIIGQFYMAIVVAIFVGKYLTKHHVKE